MVELLKQMLYHWRIITWTNICSNNRNKLAGQFLPWATLTRIAQKAHVCTTVERLEQVFGHPKWPYLAQHGQELVKYLDIATSAFDKIFEARKESANTEENEVADKEEEEGAADTSRICELSNRDDDIVMGDSALSTSLERTPIVKVTNVGRKSRVALKLTVPSKWTVSATGNSVVSEPKRRYNSKENT